MQEYFLFCSSLPVGQVPSQIFNFLLTSYVEIILALLGF